MAGNATAIESRRTLLAAAAATVAGVTLTALRPADPVLAIGDGDVVLGATNTAATTTSIAGSVPGITTLGAGGAAAPDADAVAIHGVMHHTGNEAERPGVAVLGEADGYGRGVEGRSVTGYAVFGRSETSGTGVHGSSHAGTGVDAFSDDGWAVAAGSTRGTAVRAESQHGSAVKAYGRVRLHRSGRAIVRRSTRSVTVDVTAKGGLGGTPLCFAMVMAGTGGTWVAAVRPNVPAPDKLRIYLNHAVSGDTPVAWLVLDALPGVAPWDR